MLASNSDTRPRGNPIFSDPATHPGKATQFKPGNSGRPKGVLIGKSRAKAEAKAAVIADAADRKLRDFDGDALEYMQACYRGEIKPDPLRMSAAATALKFERPPWPPS